MRPLAGSAQPLPFSCSFKTLLLLFKDNQDGRRVDHKSSFLPGLRGIFLVTCWQDAVQAHVETQVRELNAGETTTVWPEVDRSPP